MTLYAKLTDELSNGINLLTNRINQDRLIPRCKSKRDTRESRTSSDIKKPYSTSFIDTRKGRHQQKRIYDMTDNSLVWVNDAREIHNLVLLNHKVEVQKHLTERILITADVISLEVGVELLYVLRSSNHLVPNPCGP